MASVLRDPRNGRIRIKVYVEVDRDSGRKVYLFESLPADASEADVYEAEARLEARAALQRNAGVVLTLDGLVDWYVGEYGCCSLAASTAKAYRSKYMRHVSPLIGARDAAEVTAADVVKALADAVRGARLEPVSPATANAIRAVLNAAYRAAVRAGMLAVNPVDAVRRMRETRAVRPQAFGPDEVMAITEWASSAVTGGLPDDPTPDEFDDYIVKQAAMLALATGLRVGEVCALEARDLAPARHGGPTLSVAGTVSEAGGLHAKPPKSGKARVVAIDEGTYRQLADMRSAVCAAVGPTPYLFPTHRGRLRRPRTVSERFSGACSGMGLGPRRFHELRHTHATALLEGGASVQAVAERLGHSDPSVTMRAYAHVLPGVDRQAAERLARDLRGLAGGASHG